MCQFNRCFLRNGQSNFCWRNLEPVEPFGSNCSIEVCDGKYDKCLVQRNNTGERRRIFQAKTWFGLFWKKLQTSPLHQSQHKYISVLESLYCPSFLNKTHSFFFRRSFEDFDHHDILSSLLMTYLLSIHRSFEHFDNCLTPLLQTCPSFHVKLHSHWRNLYDTVRCACSGDDGKNLIHYCLVKVYLHWTKASTKVNAISLENSFFIHSQVKLASSWLTLD